MRVGLEAGDERRVGVVGFSVYAPAWRATCTRLAIDSNVVQWWPPASEQARCPRCKTPKRDSHCNFHRGVAWCSVSPYLDQTGGQT